VGGAVGDQFGHGRDEGIRGRFLPWVGEKRDESTYGQRCRAA
jgi:hypothetical protein